MLPRESLEKDEEKNSLLHTAIDVNTLTDKVVNRGHKIDIDDKIVVVFNTDEIIKKLTRRSSDLQKTEAMLESKITTSFLRYFPRSGFLLLFGLGSLIGLAAGIGSFNSVAENTSDNSQKENYHDLMILFGVIGCLMITASLLIRYKSYKETINVHRKNGIFKEEYEKFSLLSETEIDHVQRSLTAIEYKDSTNTLATGKEARTAVKVFANERKRIASIIKYHKFMHHSLFVAFPLSIEKANPITKIILDYAIDNLEDKDDSSRKLHTFGK